MKGLRDDDRFVHVTKHFSRLVDVNVFFISLSKILAFLGNPSFTDTVPHGHGPMVVL